MEVLDINKKLDHYVVFAELVTYDDTDLKILKVRVITDDDETKEIVNSSYANINDDWDDVVDWLVRNKNKFGGIWLTERITISNKNIERTLLNEK